MSLYFTSLLGLSFEAMKTSFIMDALFENLYEGAEDTLDGKLLHLSLKLEVVEMPILKTEEEKKGIYSS